MTCNKQFFITKTVAKLQIFKLIAWLHIADYLIILIIEKAIKKLFDWSWMIDTKVQVNPKDLFFFFFFFWNGIFDCLFVCLFFILKLLLLLFFFFFQSDFLKLFLYDFKASFPPKRHENCCNITYSQHAIV